MTKNFFCSLILRAIFFIYFELFSVRLTIYIHRKSNFSKLINYSTLKEYIFFFSKFLTFNNFSTLIRIFVHREWNGWIFSDRHIDWRINYDWNIEYFTSSNVTIGIVTPPSHSVSRKSRVYPSVTLASVTARAHSLPREMFPHDAPEEVFFTSINRSSTFVHNLFKVNLILRVICRVLNDNDLNNHYWNQYVWIYPRVSTLRYQYPLRIVVGAGGQ